MDIQELLGTDYKEGMTVDDINTALQGKKIADLSSGEYIRKEFADASAKEKTQQLNKQIQDLQSQLDSKLTDDEKRAKEIQDKDKKIEDTNVIDVLNTQKKEVEKKIKRLYNLYAESDDDILLDTIQENKKQLDFINNKIQREIESNVTITNKDKVKKSLDTLQENWEYMTDKEKQTIVRSIINKVIITGNEIRIVLNLLVFCVSLRSAANQALLTDQLRPNDRPIKPY